MIAGLKLIDGEEIKVSVTGNSNIVQSNYMISHKEHWTVAEERVFMTVLAMLNKGDKEFHLYKIPLKTFIDLWDVNPKNVTSEVCAVLKSLQQKGIYKQGHTFDRTPALTRAIYEEGKDFVLVQIHPDLQKHLIDIKVNGGYTKYKLENSLKLNRAKAGVNAHRLYELCRSHARQGKTVSRAVPVEEIRNALDLGDKYSQLGGFVKKVLTPCVQKINENTDLQVFYELSGRGKKAVVTFILSIVQREKLPEPEIDPAPVPVPELPDLDPLPDFDPIPNGDDLPYWGGGDALPTERDESIGFIRDELGKLPEYEVTPEDVELLLEYCFQNGCSSSLSVADYASVNVQYCRIRWRRVKHKGGYVRNVFKENHGGWYPREY